MARQNTRANKSNGEPAKKSEQVALGLLKDFIGFQLGRAHDVSFQAFARRVGDADIGSGRFAILTLIDENPGINQTAVSGATGRDKSTLTLVLKDLERRGMLTRRRSRVDGRAYLLDLTALGKKHLALLTEHARAHDRKLDAIVGEFHKPLLIHLLERIVAGLEQE